MVSSEICICDLGEACNAMARAAKAVGLMESSGRIKFAPKTFKRDTLLTRMKLAGRERALRHLYGQGNIENVRANTLQDPHIARWHYPGVCHYFELGHYKLKSCLSSAEATGLGLTGADVADATARTYYCVPCVSLRQMQGIVDTEKGKAQVLAGGVQDGVVGQRRQRDDPGARQVRRIQEQEEQRAAAAAALVEAAAAALRERNIALEVEVTANNSPARKLVKRIRDDHQNYDRQRTQEMKALTDTITELRLQLTELETVVKTAYDDVLRARTRAAMAESSMRFSIANASWHEKKKSWVKYYLGFANWSEYKAWVKIMWPAVDQTHGNRLICPLTAFEQITICYMRIHRDVNSEGLTLYWGVGAKAISNALKTWIPCIGRIGLFLSDLDLTEAFLTEALPKEYSDAPGMGKVAAMVDGKDFVTETLRTQPQLARMGYSDKSSDQAFRQLQWSLPCGLLVYSSPAVLGRASESAVVAKCGELHLDVPLSKVPEGATATRFPAPIEAYDKARKQKGANIIARNHESDGEDDEGKMDEAPRPVVKEATEWFTQNTDRGKAKYTLRDIETKTDSIWLYGPNASPKDKLEQVELLLRIATAREESAVPKCLITYYATKNKAMLLRCKGILVEGIDSEPHRPLRLKQALGKFPQGWAILADRGFSGDETKYMNWNVHLTPHFLQGRVQFSTQEVSADALVCKLRYVAEVVYSRTVEQRFLKPIVDYHHFKRFQHALHWAQGAANMRQPLKASPDY